MLSFLYVHDSCLGSQYKYIHETEKQLNKEPFNTCDWFLYNKLSIYFGEDKTKSVHFAIKFWA